MQRSIQSTSAAGVYSNDYLLHLPPVLNIVLIDIGNLEMADQMYLNYELTKFLNEQAEGQPLAIYLRTGSGCFLVQPFTSDHKLLLDAVHKAIPRFPPHDREHLTDFDTLRQVAASLSQLPGRKNVLWFSGGSTSFLMPDAIPVQDALPGAISTMSSIRNASLSTRLMREGSSQTPRHRWW